MNVLSFTLGSRGVVEPYLGLVVGLQRAGHRVTLATSAEFTPLIERHAAAFGRRAHVPLPSVTG